MLTGVVVSDVAMLGDKAHIPRIVGKVAPTPRAVAREAGCRGHASSLSVS